MKTKRSLPTRYNLRPARVLSVPDQHRLAIARETMRLHCIGALIMGGMNHIVAARVVRELTGATVTLPVNCTCKELAA